MNKLKQGKKLKTKTNIYSKQNMRKCSNGLAISGSCN